MAERLSDQSPQRFRAPAALGRLILRIAESIPLGIAARAEWRRFDKVARIHVIDTRTAGMQRGGRQVDWLCAATAAEANNSKHANSEE